MTIDLASLQSRDGARRVIAGPGGGLSIANLTAADRDKAEPRHALVYPNVSGRTKERVAQDKHFLVLVYLNID